MIESVCHISPPWPREPLPIKWRAECQAGRCAEHGRLHCVRSEQLRQLVSGPEVPDNGKLLARVIMNPPLRSIADCRSSDAGSF